jgi:hypothetical protein
MASAEKIVKNYSSLLVRDANCEQRIFKMVRNKISQPKKIRKTNTSSHELQYALTLNG